MLGGKVLNTDYDLAEMSDLQRPNLLINSDFRYKVINQRGQQEYEYNQAHAGIYGIDHWRLYDKTKVSVNDSYITLTKLGTSPFISMVQPIEVSDYDLSDYITCTYRVRPSSSLIIQPYQTDRIINLTPNEWQTVSFTVSKEEYSVSRTGDCILFYITVKNPQETGNKFPGGADHYDADIQQGTTLDVQFVKMEVGQWFTGMLPWNITLEYLKCRRYYRTYSLNEKMCSTNAAATQVYLFFDCDIPMYKAPTVDNVGMSLQIVWEDSYVDTSVVTIGCSSYQNELRVWFTCANPIKNSKKGLIKAPSELLKLDSEIMYESPNNY